MPSSSSNSSTSSIAPNRLVSLSNRNHVEPFLSDLRHLLCKLFGLFCLYVLLCLRLYHLRPLLMIRGKRKIRNAARIKANSDISQPLLPCWNLNTAVAYIWIRMGVYL
jgi:hypothetical protein